MARLTLPGISSSASEPHSATAAGEHPVRPGKRICCTHDLADGGRGIRFMLDTGGELRPAFIVRYAGHIHAYLNKCAHRSVELDWMEGQFFDESGEFLVCATHGARYHPATGACVAGPCAGQGLIELALELVGDEVYVAGTTPAEAGGSTST